MPWLERVHQCGSLWDASEMGDRADVHCYTPPEYERKRDSLPVVRPDRTITASTCCREDDGAAASHAVTRPPAPRHTP